MIHRIDHLKTVQRLLRSNRAVGLIGARQVGKTTLARSLAKDWNGPTHAFDLEDPEDVARLQDPMLVLKSLKGLVVLDEIQRKPDLFEILRVLLDRPRSHAKFLVLGSASPELMRHSSESLAGRIHYHTLPGLDLDEVGVKQLERLWLRGGFPRSFTAKTHKESEEWRRNFITTFLERDLPQLGISIRSGTLRRFWTMLAHYHGNVWNASEFGRAFGVSDTTVRDYVDLLTYALVVRQLNPWYENISKRQVKSPKVYLADSGLMHTLLGLRTKADLEGHPKVGASWEGFMLEQVIRHLRAQPDECFFWAAHTGAEIDLLVVRGKRRWGFEFKRTSSPKTTKSMHSAVEDLKLDSLDVVHAGEATFPMTQTIRAVSASDLLAAIKPLP